MVERRLELCIGMSPLYSDAQVSREAGKKIGIREIELSEVGTIDFENTELEVTSWR